MGTQKREAQGLRVRAGSRTLWAYPESFNVFRKMCFLNRASRNSGNPFARWAHYTCPSGTYLWPT